MRIYVTYTEHTTTTDVIEVPDDLDLTNLEDVEDALIESMIGATNANVDFVIHQRDVTAASLHEDEVSA